MALTQQAKAKQAMSDSTMTSGVALNVDADNTQPNMADAPAPKPTKQPRKLPNKRPTLAEQLATQAAKQKADLLKMRKQLAETNAKLKLAKPTATRSRDSGNTWQTKLLAAIEPNLKPDAFRAKLQPKLVKNANNMLPSSDTSRTIRIDFYHSMRVFKSLTEAQRKALLAAI